MLYTHWGIALSETAAWDAIQISANDDVAVALRDLSGVARVRCGNRIEQITLREPILFGHKFALSDLAVGHEVLKYGAPIGILAQSVLAGQHVHVHNLKSRRASVQP